MELQRDKMEEGKGWRREDMKRQENRSVEW